MAKKKMYYIGLHESELDTTDLAVCAINGRLTGMIQAITREETGFSRFVKSQDDIWLIHDVCATPRTYQRLKQIVTEQLAPFIDRIRFSE